MIIDRLLNEMSHWAVWQQVVGGWILGCALYSLLRPWIKLGDFLVALADLAKAKAKRVAAGGES